MATTREKLIDWLVDLPDSTEIGIEDEDLIVIIETKAHFFNVGALPAEAIQINLEAVIETRGAMVARLRQIHDDHKGQDTDEGAMIVTFEGYICGVPNLFTTDAEEAFMFKDKTQAQAFIAEFADALMNPQVLDHP
ncbi:MAG TPA: hypothetical protein VJ875_21325 [Pyrinomonadaceae bacterium]|nr:hypothetical protein [Pyrinomonadaceae bacterium]